MPKNGWFDRIDDQEYRPVLSRELRHKARTGEIGEETLVSRDGSNYFSARGGCFSLGSRYLGDVQRRSSHTSR